MKWSLVSKYRTQLMGISMLWIMVYHNYFKWTGKNVARTLIDQGNVGVDIFLFLSGVGLYYAYQKKKNLGAFYQKRIVRLLVPYFILAIPFDLWVVNIEGGKLTFFKYLFQIAFVNNHVTTTWFIPCILILSLFFPGIYYLQNNTIKVGEKTLSRNSVTIIICSLYFLFLLFLKANCETFYNNTEIALTRAVIFVLGCHAGKYVKEEKPIPRGTVLFSLVFIIAYTFVFRSEVKLSAFWIRMSYVPLAVAYIMVFIYILMKLETRVHCTRFAPLTFLGSMTLELYLVHIMLRRLYSFHIGFPHFEKTAVLDYFLVIIASIIVSFALHWVFGKITDLILGGRNRNKLDSASAG